MSIKHKTTIPPEYKDNYSVQLMFNEIAKSQPLPDKEIRAYFRLMNESTCDNVIQQIKSKIINANLRFILSYTLAYQSSFNKVSMVDIYSEAKLGLIEAINAYNYKEAAKFMSFAVWHIRKNVSSLLRDSDMIKLSANQKNAMTTALKNAKSEECIDEFMSKSYENATYMSIMRGTASLDAPLDDSNTGNLGELTEDTSLESIENKYKLMKVREKIESIFNSELTKEERNVISCLLGLQDGEEQTLRTVGHNIKKSHERVRQVRDKAFIKLRKSFDSELLSDIFSEVDFSNNNECLAI